MKIIIVYGDRNVGKTTVVNEFIQAGACVNTPKVQQGHNPKDFDAELLYNGKNVALMSMGDFVAPVANAVVKYQHSDVLITAYNTRHATLKSECLKYANEIIIVRKTFASNADNSSVLQQVKALI